MKNKWFLCLLFLLLFLTSSSRVFAHSNLLNSIPHNGEVVSVSPDRISLDFSEELEPNLIDLRMYDWNAHSIPIQGPFITPKRQSEMYAVLPHNLKNGSYTIVWNVVSQDGHPVTGSYLFSIGHVIVGNGIPQGSEQNTLQNLLIVIRYVVEGIVLLASGLYGITYVLRKREYLRLESLSFYRKWIIPILLLGTGSEWFVYTASLPGGDMTHELLAGQWSILVQSRFALMVLVQFVLLVLLWIPQMVEAWYGFVWMSLTANMAFGGHAWAVRPVWFNLAIRILHLISISIWLGSLTYSGIVFYRQAEGESKADTKPFRGLFFRVLLATTSLIVLTGFLMTVNQTGIQAFTKGYTVWSLLLWLKILLFTAMLVLASKQTRRWKQDGISLSLLRAEWFIGVLVVLFGVWMSQIAYPIPIKSYEKELEANHTRVDMTINKLTVGTQTVQIRWLNETSTEPQNVHIQLDMTDMDMSFQPISAHRVQKGIYQAKIPFTMTGNWMITIDAEYQLGQHKQWSDTVFIPGESN